MSVSVREKLGVVLTASSQRERMIERKREHASARERDRGEGGEGETVGSMLVRSSAEMT